MLNKISQKDKALILIEFTKYLLMHSNAGEVAKLKNILRFEEIEEKRNPFVHSGPISTEEIKEIVKEKKREPGLFIKKREKNEIIFENVIKEPRTAQKIPRMRRPLVLRIPEPRLPANLQYLKPTPHSVEIDLGKLNSFIQDPVVRKIDCNGPGEYITAMVPMPRHTNIILNKEEIDEVVKAFEKKSRIPAQEGIYNVVIGRLAFSAIISEVLGSKFSIKKMPYGFT